MNLLTHLYYSHKTPILNAPIKYLIAISFLVITSILVPQISLQPNFSEEDEDSQTQAKGNHPENVLRIFFFAIL